MSALLSACCRSLVSVARTAAATSLLRANPAAAVAAPTAISAISATSAALRLQHQSNQVQVQVRSYQVRASIKPRCEHCYMVMRKGRRYILCKKVARHKQRQG